MKFMLLATALFLHVSSVKPTANHRIEDVSTQGDRLHLAGTVELSWNEAEGLVRVKEEFFRFKKSSLPPEVLQALDQPGTHIRFSLPSTDLLSVWSVKDTLPRPLSSDSMVLSPTDDAN